MNIFNVFQLKKRTIKFWRKRGVNIGSGTRISSSVTFGSEPYLVEIGMNCNITDNVSFIPHDGGVHVLRNLYPDLKNIDLFKGITKVGDNTFIGNSTLILPGVEIGSNCIIGCGSIVTKNIPNNSVACGIPAKIIETIDSYKEKNKKFFVQTKKMTRKEKEKFLIEKYVRK